MAGDGAAAAALTVETARRALSRGALASAELAAERARTGWPPGFRDRRRRPRSVGDGPGSGREMAAARTIGLGLLGRLVDWANRRIGRSRCCSIWARGALAGGDAAGGGR